MHNFRNHKSILDFPNKHMYSNELIASANPMITQKLLRWDGFPNPNFPVLFHGVIGTSPPCISPRQRLRSFGYLAKATISEKEGRRHTSTLTRSFRSGTTLTTC